MSKGVSLDGVKKVLEKIKELLNKKADKTALTSYVNTYDYNKLTVDANSLHNQVFIESAALLRMFRKETIQILRTGEI